MSFQATLLSVFTQKNYCNGCDPVMVDLKSVSKSEMAPDEKCGLHVQFFLFSSRRDEKILPVWSSPFLSSSKCHTQNNLLFTPVNQIFFFKLAMAI